MRQTTSPTDPSQTIPSFDQIVKGNVCIKKLNEYNYKITFSKIGKFLMYQVWDKDSPALNKKRSVSYVSAKNWVKAFKKYNNDLAKNSKPLFTPTTIMETEDDRVYAFVIHNADLNSHDQVVFTVSTKEISPQNNTSKKLIQLPLGKCNNVRFDIDDLLQYWFCRNDCENVPPIRGDPTACKEACPGTFDPYRPYDGDNACFVNTLACSYKFPPFQRPIDKAALAACINSCDLQYPN
jgi:hypothetical protein